MRKGKSDNLAGEGRVGQRFLIPGHGGAETHLPHRTGCLRMGAKAAPPKDGAIRQHQGGSGAGGNSVGGMLHKGTRLFVKVGLQIGQTEAGDPDHRGPVTRRNGTRLAPFAHRLGAHARQFGRRIRATHTFYDIINGDRHSRQYMGRNFPLQPSTIHLGNLFRPTRSISPKAPNQGETDV
jgi:hypothetical protein